MANIKSILDSVDVLCGTVHFPSRYAAREVMETMEELFHFDRADYRILAVDDSPFYAVYWSRTGVLFDVHDLSSLKGHLGL